VNVYDYKMVFKTKEEDDKKALIEFDFWSDDDKVSIKINEEIVATFHSDGKFKFFGKNSNPKYEGNWKEQW